MRGRDDRPADDIVQTHPLAKQMTHKRLLLLRPTSYSTEGGLKDPSVAPDSRRSSRNTTPNLPNRGKRSVSAKAPPFVDRRALRPEQVQFSFPQNVVWLVSCHRTRRRRQMTTQIWARRCQPHGAHRRHYTTALRTMMRPST